jgi:hypothetical protein
LFETWFLSLIRNAVKNQAKIHERCIDLDHAVTFSSIPFLFLSSSFPIFPLPLLFLYSSFPLSFLFLSSSFLAFPFPLFVSFSFPYIDPYISAEAQETKPEKQKRSLQHKSTKSHWSFDMF